MHVKLGGLRLMILLPYQWSRNVGEVGWHVRTVGLRKFYSESTKTSVTKKPEPLILGWSCSRTIPIMDVVARNEPGTPCARRSAKL
jgi:hypothetical protein